MKVSYIKADNQTLKEFLKQLRQQIKDYERGLGHQCKEKIEARLLEQVAKDMGMKELAIWINCLASSIHPLENAQKIKDEVIDQ